MTRCIARTIGALWVLQWLPLASAAGAQTSGALAAIVNGDKITADDWTRRMQSLRAQDFVLSANPLRFKPDTGGKIALDALVNARLLLQYAAKTSLTASDSEIAEEMKRLKARPDIVDGLAKKQFTEEQLRQDVVIQRTYFNVATTNLSITNDEIKAFYDRHPEQWGRPERWRLGMIRVATKDAADKVQAALKAGSPFETVAAQMSEDARSKINGGDIGQVNASDTTLPAYVREAIQKLKVGEVTPPVTAPGPVATTAQKPPFIFMRLTGRESANVKPFETVKEEARRLAILDKANAAGTAEKKLSDFRKASTVTILLPGYEEPAKQ